MPTKNFTNSGNPSFQDRVNNLEVAAIADEAVIVTQNSLAQLVANGAVFPLAPVSAVSDASATHTLTMAEFLTSVIDYSGGATPTVTTPTAAAIVAAIPGCLVGTSFRLSIRNRNSGALTLAGGTTVTLTTGSTTTIANGSTRNYFVVVTNITPSSEAVSIYSTGVGVH